MTVTSFERDFARLARAINAVLIAGHGQRHWLKPDRPPFQSRDTGDRGYSETDVVTRALQHYGGQPSAAFDLWAMCRAIEELSLAWTGAEPVVVDAVGE